MALWGNNDSVYSAGTITEIYAPNVNDAVIITGSGTLWADTAAVDSGQVVTIPGYGSGVILSPRGAGIGDNLAIALHPHNFTHTADITGINTTYNISEQPTYTVEDSHYGSDEIYGVDRIEAGLARTTAYAVAHSGWVGIMTYTDTHGNLRVKHEVLVAGGILTTSDATDDTFFPE